MAVAVVAYPGKIYIIHVCMRWSDTCLIFFVRDISEVVVPVMGVLVMRLFVVRVLLLAMLLLGAAAPWRCCCCLVVVAAAW